MNKLYVRLARTSCQSGKKKDKITPIIIVAKR